MRSTTLSFTPQWKQVFREWLKNFAWLTSLRPWNPIVSEAPSTPMKLKSCNNGFERTISKPLKWCESSLLRFVSFLCCFVSSENGGQHLSYHPTPTVVVCVCGVSFEIFASGCVCACFEIWIFPSGCACVLRFDWPIFSWLPSWRCQKRISLCSEVWCKWWDLLLFVGSNPGGEIMPSNILQKKTKNKQDG